MGSRIVSISDEAFGLLLIDNDFEKWQILAEEDIEVVKDTEPAQEAETARNRPGQKESEHKKTRKVHLKSAGNGL
jgi:hypothetical protein